MKKNIKNLWPLLLIMPGCLLFATKEAKCQSGTFDKLTLKDKDGTEERTMHSTFQLVPGKLKVSEDGQEWLEQILFQSKGIDSCEVETLAGHYLLLLERGTIKEVYLRSNVGADRIYHN